ncbi:MAG: CBS domain-containing protein [Candidatus Nanoarchaeia archaeon]|nr:CBS domain-containing protein [Candidatus Nanoarchaeia archaeon]MDD5499760.1 CBS domain-containing protein [Candidatus Nanoarchaeia archaeon]
MIKSIMSTKLATLTPDDTINTALNLMDAHNYKELPVIDGKNKLLGVVTYSNILEVVKFNGNAKVINFIEGVPIIHETDSKQYVLSLMIDSGLMGLPIVDKNEVLVGFVSDYDLLNHYKEGLKQYALTEANLKKVPSVKENATLSEAKNLLTFNKRDRLPVINKKGEFVGTILFIDILRRIHKSDSSKSKKNIISEKSNVLNTPIIDMIRRGVKITYDSNLYDTAETMLKNQLLGLIIVNSSNEPVGAVDRCSILKLLREINTDSEIKIEIVGQVHDKAISEIKRLIKTQLKLLPSFESSIKGIKVFVKRVHDDKNLGKVDVRLTIVREGKNDLLIQKTDYDIILTLMECIDKANTLLKNKVRK